MDISRHSLYDFQAHASVMIGAFPESGLIVLHIDAAIGFSAPVPLAVGTDYAVADE